jgi:hypothetical protein
LRCYSLSPYVVLKGQESKQFLAILVQKCRLPSPTVTRPPVMIMLMHMTANRKIMGQFKVKGGLMIVGWIATAVMAGAAAAMCFTAAVSGLEM